MEVKDEEISKTKRHEDFDFEPRIEEDYYDDEEPSNKGKKKIIAVLIIVIILLSISIFLLAMYPKIKLKGSKEVKLTVNSIYLEEGAKAKVLGKDKSKNIKIKGKVNTKKKGTYTITYTIKNLFLTNKVKRIVKVVEKGPIIELEGDKDFSICPNKKYEEVGFKASFIGKDTDLTKSVKTKEKDNVVTYTVEKDGVMFITTRNLVREDKVAPEIKLNGNDHIYVTLNNKYNDAGVTVTDNCDDDLDDKVVVAGEVDTSKLGDYEINYSIKDNEGNEATIKRTVTVQKEIVRRSASLGCGKAGVIYLTFDDGPGGSTSSILNTLKKHDVKATFFVTSANGGSDDLIKREADEGHLVALHTWSHEYSQVYRSDEAYWADLNKISDRVERITGKKSKIVRFPGGSSNTVSRHYSTGIMSRMASDLESKGYNYVDWNVDSRDAEGKNCEQVYYYATTGLSKSVGNVVLMHDIKSSTACALDRIIQYGKDHGYTFDVLDSSVICHHRTAN